MKKMFFAAALIAALIPLAAAQDHRSTPKADLSREVDVRVPAQAAVLGNPPAKQAPKAPKYCKPCLFYGGDMDPANSNTNGLANENDVIVSQATVYAPFKVPKKKTWTITSAFTNNFSGVATLDPATSPFEIRKGIPAAGGSGGKLVCSGLLKNTFAPTGRSDFGFNEYTALVKVHKKCSLKSGKYWLAVVPQCTNANTCSSERAFESNEEDIPGLNHFGPAEPQNNSFFNSTFFGTVFQPANVQNPQDTAFSDGVAGTSK
jgi:hypothetical protein